jgi:mannitol-specific phosphotransferase system IIBC component
MGLSLQAIVQNFERRIVMREKLQQLGGFLAGMVIPNIGAIPAGK